MLDFIPYLISVNYTQHRRKFQPNHAFEKRITKSYELVYFLDDSNCKMVLDNQEYKIVGDTIVFRKPNQHNQSFMPYESILLCFSLEPLKRENNDYNSEMNQQGIIMDRIINNLFVNNIKTIYHKSNQANYRKIFEDIYKESLLNRQYSSYYFSSKLMEILYGLYHENNSSLYTNHEQVTDEDLLVILSYIHSNLNKYFTIQRMGKDLAISERSIYKLFKEHLKTTPVQYINECKLNYSKKLLLNSNVSVHKIARMSGYDNSTYYITLFKKRYGMTPLQYRNQAVKT
ncbi:AraC family transcriptional regulator [Vallitalea sediminicola]